MKGKKIVKKKIVVLDIGGTSIKSGLWDGEKLLEIREQETCAKNGGDFVMKRARDIIASYGDFRGIGISTAGQVDFSSGSIRYANENIPGYTGMQVKKILEKEFDVATAVENDVNAAAIGEAVFGAGRDIQDFLCVTYGTGVGGAIVSGGALYRGSTYSAGEFGGIITHPEQRQPGSPFSGCYENYASTTALVRMVKTKAPHLDTGRKIFMEIEEPWVRRMVDDWIKEITYGLVSLIHIFNPACVVLGGGIMAQPYVAETLRTFVHEEIMESFQDVRLVQAQLGNHAGMMGAVHLAQELL